VSWDGLDALALASLIGAPRLELADSVGSTLDLAHELAAQGAAAGTIVLADAQTVGRGRQGRAWSSPPGRGIWLTVILRPAAAPAGGALAVRAGLACLDALRAVHPGLAPRLKWPNDLMVLDRKAGGILCEARWASGRLAWVAVGLGLNVHGPVPAEVRDLAIALDDVVHGVARATVLAALAPRLMVLGRAEATLSFAERAAFLDSAWVPPGESVAGIEPDGALLVRREGGVLERRVEAA
jgi:BirA family biotin operon repressor/biotin-[acetyl-CoA-carboxylase] ligase